MLHPEGLSGLLACGGVALLCFVVGILLMNGRGLMFIAGYNTMTKEKRARVNGKALGKAVGVYMLVTGIWVVMTGLGAYLGYEAAIWVLFALFAVGTLVFVIYINRSKRFKQ